MLLGAKSTTQGPPWGFVCNGITNALDGSEDIELTDDVAGFWHDLRMPEVREAVRSEVTQALRQERVSRFEDYTVLLDPYPAHAAMQEGQEAFGIEVNEKGDVASEAGSATEDDGLQIEEDDPGGDVDVSELKAADERRPLAQASSKSQGLAQAPSQVRLEMSLGLLFHTASGDASWKRT